MSGSDISRSPSPSTPRSNASAELTPRRKVQAALAGFSDSESDDIPSKIARPVAKTHPINSKKTASTLHNDYESDTEDDEVVLPRGKAAARLLGHTSVMRRDSEQGPDSIAASEDELSRSEPQAEVPGASKPSTLAQSEDETSAVAPRRRFLVKKKGRPDQSPGSVRGLQERSVSPMLSPSPSSQPHNPARDYPDHDEQPDSSMKQQSDGRSKFLALVEKHRKERIAKEAAEVAKRAAGMYEDEDDTPKPRGQRGSSPADDSAEESNPDDDGAAQRIAKEARPTRKASKKAIEEMNRETQRMNRNMQLAHQATTKKKITKESLLARFNFFGDGDKPSEKLQSANSSSVAGSDSETEGQHDTPPTSPLREPEPGPGKKQNQSSETSHEMSGIILPDGGADDLTAPILHQPSTSKLDRVQEYITNNRTVFSPEPEHLTVLTSLVDVNMTDSSNNHIAPQTKNSRPNFRSVAASDSDSEIEIVQDKGSRRKYAAFETLPKRKAKEKPSHLALRSLAHLMANDGSKLSKNSAQVEVDLRRKARMQALEERKQRIEDLKARGVIIQTSEERERDQQEVEDLVERARQEAAEIQKREKELAKKDGTYVNDGLDDEEDESDEDFEEDGDEEDADEISGSEDELQKEEDAARKELLIDDEVDEGASDDDDEEEQETDVDEAPADADTVEPIATIATSKPLRRMRVISDDEDEDDDHQAVEHDKENQSPLRLPAAKTPQSITRSARKVIPGLQMSDDLPMGLSQAFAATMAESQEESVDDNGPTQDNHEMPSPIVLPVAQLHRLDSIEMISDSQPAPQTLSLSTNLHPSPIQAVPESPAQGLGIFGHQFTPSERQFDLTQDEGYLLSPFAGSRFAETPSRRAPQSTVDTLIIPGDAQDSPIISRKRKLRRGRVADDQEEDEANDVLTETAFEVMKHAATRKAAQAAFDKSKSEARQHFDEAAEESEDEYAGLGGASDDDAEDEENEEDRRMIDEDTQIGAGDEAKLAGFYADRERAQDEKDVSKLLKDITTGALRRKRGVGDDLDLSDEEDAVARRREAKRREFARMRRELLKDEAVGKIAEDKKKQAFLRSIEDREEIDNDDEDLPTSGVQDEADSQSQDVNGILVVADSQDQANGSSKRFPLETASDARTNRLPPSLRRTQITANQKPSNLAEIRETVSFLIEEPESQAAMVDLGLSDSEDEPEAYVDLDRHFREAEHDENFGDEDGDDLGDFIVDDEKDDSQEFKKPDLPSKERAPFWERRGNRDKVVDRLSLIRQSSSSTSSGSNASSKMAFYTSKPGSSAVSKVPQLLRRATTNSSLGLGSGRENVSATGVSTNYDSNRTERGNAATEKEFIRKGSNGRRNAVNFQARTTLKEEKMSQRAGIAKAHAKSKKKGANGFLNGLFRGDSWS